MFVDSPSVIALAQEEANDRFAHPAKQRISPPDWDSLQNLLDRLGAAFRPMLVLRGAHDLEAWVVAHKATLEAITAGDDGAAGGEDRVTLEALFDELSRSSTAGMRFDAESYGFFFASVAREVTLRGPKKAHPRLKIFGLLEARLMEADVMLLGGLDEMVWPPQARADAFLNRPMRTALGLTPPERKLGQTAHDFTQAMGRSNVILSRAMKRGGAPTVASRFIQRMAALGDETWKGCVSRGKYYVDLARMIDRPATVAPPLKRPMPRPPIELRPKSLSVTRIETLRRDPYALYAELILGLIEMPPIGGAPELAQVGSAVHAALERFVKDYPVGALPAAAREDLSRLLREGLKHNLEDADFRAFNWPRIERMIDFFLSFEAGRRDRLQEIKTEISGKLEMKLGDGSLFTLNARADRIELARDGAITLVDYKMGTPPGKKEVFVGFAPQLTLEAAMTRRGAFDLSGNRELIEGLYLKLGGDNGGAVKPIDFEKQEMTFMEVAESHFHALLELLNQFRDPATPYPPRPFPKFAKSYNAYDHLARVKEWSVSGEAEGEA
jgi:ATP-dependent helicase/nuclease subunit B